MGGGLMQLVAYGVQDIYLTGNPQITFFKVVYRRHTNFSMESIKQVFDGNAAFGGTVTATISRNGDLVHRIYLEHDAKFIGTREVNYKIGVVSNYGSNLMKKMEIEIGGQLIDRHYGHYHAAYNELTKFNPTGYHTTLYNRMSGNGIGHSTGSERFGSPGEHRTLAASAGWQTVDAASELLPKMEGKFWIPLLFWFCRNPGLALPLIALQYHEVKIKIEFEKIGDIMADGGHPGWDHGSTTLAGDSNNDNGSTFDLWCDYIYLDTDERRRFAQVSHEYLIEQVQHTSINKTGAFTKKLHFNHPIKELIWKNQLHPLFSPAGILYDADPNDFHGHAQHHSPDSVQYLRAPFSLSGEFQLKLNGHDRFSERDYRYFTRTQVWQHHTGYGGFIGQDQDGESGRGNESRDTIAVYSFALKPEEHQPSGTCNFSRIDNAELIRSGTGLSLLHGGINVYAINYNVLRIMSGMGGLAYSN